MDEVGVIFGMKKCWLNVWEAMKGCLHAFCRKTETLIHLFNKLEKQVKVCSRIPLVIPTVKLTCIAVFRWILSQFWTNFDEILCGNYHEIFIKKYDKVYKLGYLTCSKFINPLNWLI